MSLPMLGSYTTSTTRLTSGHGRELGGNWKVSETSICVAPARYEDVAILLAAAQGGVLHLMHSHHTFLLHEKRLMLQQVEPLLKGVLSVVWDDDRGAEELEVGDHVPPGPLQAGGPGTRSGGGKSKQLILLLLAPTYFSLILQWILPYILYS